MFFLFLVVSMIDVIGIGMIGPFVALLGHDGRIVTDYPIFFSMIGDVDNSTIIIFMGILLVIIFGVKSLIAFFVQRKIISLGYEIRTSLVTKLIRSYQAMSYENIVNRDIPTMIVTTNTHVGLFIDSVFVPTLRMSIEFIVVVGIIILMAYTSPILVIMLSKITPK